VLTTFSKPLCARTVGSILGATVWMISKTEKRHNIGRGFEIDVAAISTITAVGAAVRDMRLTPEGNRTGSAVASLYMSLCLIYEACHRCPQLKK
jgi:hypothetical protein